MSDTNSAGVPNDGTVGENAAEDAKLEDGSYIDSELDTEVAAPDSDVEGEYTDSDLS